MRDTVQHFCEKHLDKIKAYMQKVFVKLPLPIRCGIEGNLFCGLLECCFGFSLYADKYYIIQLLYFCNLLLKLKILKYKFYLCTIFAVNFRYCSSLNYCHSSLISCVYSFLAERKNKKHAKLYFACQGKGEHCLYSKHFFTMKTRNPRIWIHLMFLALQVGKHELPDYHERNIRFFIFLSFFFV